MTKLKKQDEIYLVKRLGFLLEANLAILASLKTLLKSGGSKRQRLVLKLLCRNIARGKTLSESLRESGSFSPFTIYLAEMGESSGRLASSLKYAAEDMERKRKLLQKTRSALIYPSLIFVVSIVITVLLITEVFPKILPILQGLKGPLPVPTRVLIFLSHFLKSFGWITFASIMASIFLFMTALRKWNTFRYRLQILILYLPLLRELSVFYQLSNFSRVIGLLLQNGLVLESSLRLVAENTENLVYSQASRLLRSSILEGQLFSKGIRSLKRSYLLFTPIFDQMIEVGESTGRLSEIMLYLSELYENELAEKSKVLSSFLEPVLMIFLGLIIGGVALSIIMPIYQITANLSH